jgi:hypothetical protein
MTIRTLLVAVVFALTLVVVPAEAQVENKRVKCASFVDQGDIFYNRLKAYVNFSDESRLISFQVRKWGCRPVGSMARYQMMVSPINSETPTFEQPVLASGARFSSLYTIPIPPQSKFEIFYEVDPGVRVTGTFDYILTVE